MNNNKLAQTNNDSFLTACIGFPTYDKLSQADKRILLLPLVDAIRDFYKDPENRKQFEKWKSENYSTE